jgi:hypothetical protein
MLETINLKTIEREKQSDSISLGHNLSASVIEAGNATIDESLS